MGTQPVSLDASGLSVPQAQPQAQPAPDAQSVLSGAQAQAQQPTATQPPAQPHRSIWKNILSAAIEGMAGSDPSQGSGFLGGVGNGAKAAEQSQAQQQQAAAQQQAAQEKAAQDAQKASDGHLTTLANLQLGQKRLIAADDAHRQAQFNLSDDAAKNLSTLGSMLDGATVEKVGSGNINDLLTQLGGDGGQEFGQGRLIGIPNGDGTVTAYRVPADWSHQMNTEPVSFQQMTGVDPKTGQPKYITQTVPAGGASNGQLAALITGTTAKGIQTETSLATQNMKDSTAINRAKIAANAKAASGSNAAPNLTPSEYQSLVDGVSNYSVDPGNLLRYGKAFQTKLLADARLKNPDFDQTRYNAYAGLEKSFTEGANSTKVQSFNALIGHTSDMMQGIDALRNTGSPLLNTPINKLKQSAGSPAVSQVLAQIMPARTEFQNFLNNNHALKQEDVAEGRKLLNENMSPAQFEATAKQFMRTSVIRLNAINQTYKGVRGKNWRNILSPESGQALRNAGFGQDVDALTGNGQPQQQQAQPQPKPGQSAAPPTGATNPVYGADGKTLIGYAVGGKFNPIAGGN